MTGCAFCDYGGPSPILAEYAHSVVFEPINPVTEGHVLVVPKEHLLSVAEAPPLTGWVIQDACAFAIEQGVGDCHFIINDGRAAGQTVDHLHLHIVPRRPGDGLKMPWSSS